jgi:DNA-directed RNA polymerase subunit RPC12/RpoP
MSKENQIEEMAKIFCGMKNGCDGCMWGKVHCKERNYAEEIYNAGYRKQSEGKWISCKNNSGYKCSECGARIKNSAFFNGNHTFCHNCGAKMKGGAE